jgi:hypothetical protein
MNIFAVNNDPHAAARDLPDKLIVKMPSECQQMLSVWAFELYEVIDYKTSGEPYKHTSHKNHPCTRWVVNNPNNTRWLIEHAKELCAEFTRRRNKVHGSERPIRTFDELLKVQSPMAQWSKHEPFKLCMPDQYKVFNDAQECYREFMLGEKGYAAWKHCSEPAWWDANKFAKTKAKYLQELAAKKHKHVNSNL